MGKSDEGSKLTGQQCAGAQPPANVWQPSGLARSARLQVERHTLERPQCAVGFGDVGELEGEDEPEEPPSAVALLRVLPGGIVWFRKPLPIHTPRSVTNNFGMDCLDLSVTKISRIPS
jgi:hypothetical protein